EIARLRDEVTTELAEQGVAEDSAAWQAKLQIRYDGTDTPLPVNYDGSLDAARRDFERAHKAQFGFIYDDKPMVVEAVNVEGYDKHDAGPREPQLETREET